MLTFLFSLILISGIVFIISVLLMSPKGGLGFGVGGMATSNEYGSKKSLEGTLKKSATLSIIVFTISSIIYPYLNRKNYKPVKKQPTIQVETQDTKVKKPVLPGVNEMINSQQGNSTPVNNNTQVNGSTQVNNTTPTTTENTVNNGVNVLPAQNVVPAPTNENTTTNKQGN